MNLKDVSPFKQKVYEACLQVPEGQVTTYKLLAAEIGCGSSQAVGQALKVNPFAPEVPCHRVVKTDRSLGGFFGSIEGEEIVRKRALLTTEGVAFDADERVSEASVFRYSPVSA